MSVSSPTTNTMMHERSQLWLSQRDERLHQASDHEEAKMLSQLQHIPKIDAVSAKLAATSTRASVDVSTRLFKDAEKLRETRRHLEDDALAAASSGIPSITTYAAALTRDGDIADRLYAQAKILDEKKKAAAEAADKQARAAASTTPRASRSRSMDLGASGMNMNNNNNNSSSSSSSTHQQLGPSVVGHTVEQLYRLGQELRAKKEAMARALEVEAKQGARPRLNAHSLEIAANMSEETLQRLYHKDIAGKYPKGSKERAAADTKAPSSPPSPSSNKLRDTSSHALVPGSNRPGSPRGASTNASPRKVVSWEAEMAEATFHPKIEKKSVILAAKRFGGNSSMPVEQRLMTEAQHAAVRKQEIAKNVAEAELRDCTFQPNADRRHHNSSSSPRGTNGGKPVSTEVVGQRIFTEQVAWLKEKEVKLLELKKDLAEKELIGCTFKPSRATNGGGRRSSLGGLPSGMSGSFLGTGTSARRSSLPGGSGISMFGSGITNENLNGEDFISSRPPGYDRFMERLERGRQITTEKTNPPFVDGSKWTKKLTKAIAPRFHGRGSSSNNGSASADENSTTSAAFNGNSTSSNASTGKGGFGGLRARVIAAIHTRPSSSSSSSAPGQTSVVAGLPIPGPMQSVTQIISAAVAKVAAQTGRTVSTNNNNNNINNNNNTNTNGIPSRATELSTAEDIRARLRQLEALGSGSSTANNSNNNNNNRIPAASTVSVGFPTTVVGGAAPPKGALMALARQGSNANNNHHQSVNGTNTNHHLLPPDIRFSGTSTTVGQNQASKVFLGSAVGPSSPDPLLGRLEAMAAAAVGGGRR